MNNKQKLGYMLLGAAIMAIGIVIGQIITPDIEAQSNGVFDKITCREIEVADKDGKKAIVLSAYEGSNRIILYDPDGKDGRTAIGLFAWGDDRRGNQISVYDKHGNLAIALSTWESSNSGEPINEVSVHGKHKSGIGLYSNYDGLGKGNQVYVYDEHRKGSAFLAVDETSAYVTLYDKHNNPAIRLNAGEQSNEVIVHQKHEKEVSTLTTKQAILLSSNNFDNGVNRVLLNDRAGMPGVSFFSAWDSARGTVKGNSVGVFEATGKITTLGD